MKLYLIHRKDRDSGGWDTYSEAVVCANSADEARTMHPCDGDGRYRDDSEWISAKDVQVKYLGEAKEGSCAKVVCASFNAG